ncbi:MAG: hypothetical protein ACTSVR_08405 [Candidatus Thorarchaeota archaeon]
MSLDIERHNAIDLIEAKKSQGKWSADMVYSVCLRAFEDRDRAEHERAMFLLKEMGSDDSS